MGKQLIGQRATISDIGSQGSKWLFRYQEKKKNSENFQWKCLFVSEKFPPFPMINFFLFHFLFIFIFSFNLF